jgi:superfamily II RNA helicase
MKLELAKSILDTTTMTSYFLHPDATIPPPSWPPTEEMALVPPYELDPFQKHGVLGIHAGNHIFVTAKTGSGKTFLGEYLIARALQQGKRVFYTTPIKSLSNQKYYDLKKLFPQATIGILTGDIKMMPHAQVLVMTAEILRNLLFKRGTMTESVGRTAVVSLDDVAGVVMDEAHYIQDPDRGHVWEETLILLKTIPSIQLVLLSATMPSAASLAQWLAELHARHTMLIDTKHRVVPLVHGLLNKAGDFSVMLDAHGFWNHTTYTLWLRDRTAQIENAEKHKQAVAARKNDGYRTAPPTAGKVHLEEPLHRLKRTVRHLVEKKWTPALFFIFSRKECERFSSAMEGSFLTPSESANVAHILSFHLARTHQKENMETMPQYHKIHGLLLRGIAFHHSGLLPLLKELVEILFTRGFVKLLFATETFSVGLNMPTKTVVFLDLQKYTDGGQRRVLRTDEYIQMAGRAGRRGIDTQGIVLYEPMVAPLSFGEVKQMLIGTLPPLSSQMRFHYEFLLKHCLSGSTMPLVEQSYWAVQQKESRKEKGDELVRINDRLTSFSVTDEEKRELDEYDLLETQAKETTNASRKRAQLAMKRWEDSHVPRATWLSLRERYNVWKDTKQAYDFLSSELAAWDSSPLLELGPQESCLRAWGFLTEERTLTMRGILASEVNEGHSILMPCLLSPPISTLLAHLTGEEIVCILACFLHETTGKEEEPSLEELGLRKEITDVLYALDEHVSLFQKEERAQGVHSPSGYWNLSTLWILVVSRWFSGHCLSQIAGEFGIFEGNVQRGLLRIANSMEEWASLLTLQNDFELLEKMHAVHFLRDELVVDSLYLRM